MENIIVVVLLVAIAVASVVMAYSFIMSTLAEFSTQQVNTYIPLKIEKYYFENGNTCFFVRNLGEKEINTSEIKVYFDNLLLPSYSDVNALLPKSTCKICVPKIPDDDTLVKITIPTGVSETYISGGEGQGGSGGGTQQNIYYIKAYGGVIASFYDVELNENGYIVFGTRYTAGTETYGLIISTTKDGNIIWAKEYNCPNEYGDPSAKFYDAVKIGTLYYTIWECNGMPLLFAVDNKGNIVKGPVRYEYANARPVKIIDAGNGIVGVFTKESDNNVYLFKTDYNFNFLWGKVHTFSIGVRVMDVGMDADGNIVMGGGLLDPVNESYFLLMKTNSEGNIIYAKYYTLSLYKEEINAVVVKDTNVYFLGRGEGEVGGRMFFFGKADYNGVLNTYRLIYIQEPPETEYAGDGVIYDGNLFFAYSLRDVSGLPFEHKGLVLKMGFDGNVYYAKKYDFWNPSYFYGVLHDGEAFVFVGNDTNGLIVRSTLDENIPSCPFISVFNPGTSSPNSDPGFTYSGITSSPFTPTVTIPTIQVTEITPSVQTYCQSQ